MISDKVVQAEWEQVKDVPSLYMHYDGDRRLYQKWHGRFKRKGLLKNRKTSWRKPRDLEKRRLYARQYYKGWRQRNPERVKRYQLDHWKRKIAAFKLQENVAQIPKTFSLSET